MRRASFVIAHCLYTITEADVNPCMNDGKIVASGRYEELMETKGDYYRLFTRQYEDVAMKEVFL